MRKIRLLLAALVVSFALGAAACSSPVAPDYESGPNNYEAGPNT